MKEDHGTRGRESGGFRPACRAPTAGYVIYERRDSTDRSFSPAKKRACAPRLGAKVPKDPGPDELQGQPDPT